MACRLGVYPSTKLVIFAPDDGLSPLQFPDTTLTNDVNMEIKIFETKLS